MNLSSDLISQFVKTTKDTSTRKSETISYGTIVENGDSIYVKLDGSDMLTPISTTAGIKDGERVTVMIKNHTAIVTGNITSPSASNDDVLEIGAGVDEIVLKVNDVSKTANEAAKKANSADTAASNALSKADEAGTAANNALSKANEVTTTANDAVEKANAAGNAANNALSKADAAGEKAEDASKTATNFLSLTADEGLQIGDHSNGSWVGFRAQITNAAFNILDAAGNALSSYGVKLVELGKNATDAIIKLCGGKGQIEYITDDDTSDEYLQVTASKLRLKSDEMSSLYSVYTDDTTRWEKSAVNVSSNKINMYASECIDPSLPDMIEGWNTSDVSINSGNINITTPGDVTINAASVRDSHGCFYSVVEGTSGIWSYRKFQNGDIELWGSYPINDMECIAVLGGMYRTDVFQPTAFPFTIYNPNLVASYESDGYGAMLWATAETTTTSPPSYYLIRPTSITIVSGKINFHVRGKWTT